jgi:hypothetical protein
VLVRILFIYLLSISSFAIMYRNPASGPGSRFFMPYPNLRPHWAVFPQQSPWGPTYFRSHGPAPYRPGIQHCPYCGVVPMNPVHRQQMPTPEGFPHQNNLPFSFQLDLKRKRDKA